MEWYVYSYVSLVLDIKRKRERDREVIGFVLQAKFCRCVSLEFGPVYIQYTLCADSTGHEEDGVI